MKGLARYTVVLQMYLRLVFLSYGIFMNKRSNMTSVHKIKKTDRSICCKT